MKTIECFRSLAMFLVLVFFMFSARMAAAWGPQAGSCNWGNYNMPNVTYVSTDGSSRYNCSGGTSCQDAINAAIQATPANGTVFLKKGTYIISDPIVVKSNFTLEGDKDAIVKLKDHADWKSHNTSGMSILDPLIGAGGAGGSNRSHDVVIRCFTIDGNKRNNESRAFYNCIGDHQWAKNFSRCEIPAYGGDRYHGNNYYTLIYFAGGSNFSIHDMTMTDALNDGFKFSSLSDVKFYNNSVSGMGHEGVFAMNSHGIEVYHNDFKLQASDGVRGSDCYDYVIHDNEFQSLNRKDSSAGIQIAVQHGKPVYNVQIYRNVFHDIWNGGIWLSTAVPMHGSEYPISIHHNIFVGNGYSTNSSVGATGGIISSGGSYSIIYNNVFVDNYGSGIYDRNKRAKIVNNIIVGTKAGKYSGAGTGAGVVGGSTVSNNYFYQNAGGDMLQASGTGNANGNPLFADRAGQDFHLLSQAGRWDPAQSRWVADSQSSPCIDWGISASADSVAGDYSKEPANNGGRVNAGVYGNTSQASLSGTSPQNPMPPAPKEEDYPKGFSDNGGDNGGSDGGNGGGNEVTLPIYPYSPDSTLPDLEPPVYVLPALADEQVPVTPLYPTPADAPATATDACMVRENSAGLIPCGKSLNDPATAWNECQECGFCSFALMIQLILEFLIRIMGILALLVLIASGAYHIVAAGNAAMLAKAKSMAERAVLGFVIILAAWIMVDSILTTLGFIDPLDGEWYMVCGSTDANVPVDNNAGQDVAGS